MIHILIIDNVPRRSKYRCNELDSLINREILYILLELSQATGYIQMYNIHIKVQNENWPPVK